MGPALFFSYRRWIVKYLNDNGVKRMILSEDVCVDTVGVTIVVVSIGVVVGIVLTIGLGVGGCVFVWFKENLFLLFWFVRFVWYESRHRY